jgi:hypothetical protein
MCRSGNYYSSDSAAHGYSAAHPSAIDEPRLRIIMWMSLCLYTTAYGCYEKDDVPDQKSLLHLTNINGVSISEIGGQSQSDGAR